jgi:16S rRNA (cytosine967-C5)-methyltransferase
MTPAARLAAAADLLDRALAGEPAERALTQWGRDNRYAGSGDRAAIRDHVYDALRRRRSLAALGGSDTGRGLILGLLRAAGTDPDTVFTGAGHAPPPLTQAERDHRPPPDLPLALRADMPDWLADRLTAAHGAAAMPAMMALRDRAPVHLRVNIARATRDTAARALAAEGIPTVAHPDVKTALQVTGNERKIRVSQPYLTGLVELQDAASQMAVLALPLQDGDRVLDYCAGGGGKSLAMGARARLDLVAHDANPARMADLAPRAARAGLALRQARTADLPALAPFDLVLVDAPCSGSGTWRRTPEAKWRLTAAALAALTTTQDAILAAAAPLVRPGGFLAYATCSILPDENDDRIARFRDRHPGWTVVSDLRLMPGPLHDGFYLCVMQQGAKQPIVAM